MNKSQFIESFKEVIKKRKFNDISVDDVESVVNIFFSSIVEALLEGKKVELRGFGVFELRDYKGYAGKNPKTGKPINSKPKKIPFFKPSKDVIQIFDDSSGS